MKAGNSYFLLDPYEFLPPYGETRIDIELKGALVTVNIFYDKEGCDEQKASLLFSGAVSFVKHVIPGVLTSRVEYNRPKLNEITSLLSFPKSDLTDAWLKIFPKRNFTLFKIFFSSVGFVIEIVSEDYKLEHSSP